MVEIINVTKQTPTYTPTNHPLNSNQIKSKIPKNKIQEMPCNKLTSKHNKHSVPIKLNPAEFQIKKHDHKNNTSNQAKQIKQCHKRKTTSKSKHTN